jgi:hypothetical protein
VKLRRIINGQKTVTNWGKWKSGDKMPKSAYPLSKSRFKVSAPYTWRVVEFKCLGETFRLLIAFRVDLNRYQCHLGRVVGGDMLTLARYEYHATEPGWHLHCVCDDTGRTLGTMKCEDKRFPHWDSFHSQLEFGAMSEDLALKRAKEVFRLDKEPPFDLSYDDEH